MLADWILIYHINPKGKINFIKLLGSMGNEILKENGLNILKPPSEFTVYRINHKLLEGLCMVEVGWKEGVKYFDREKDLSKRPLGIKENDVKGERLYTGYNFSGGYLAGTNHDIVILTRVFRKLSN